jgi:ABC-type multidrug transport system ATPase subunit
MWTLVQRLRDSGVTIILTTHYIDEAEEVADRIGGDQQGRTDRSREENRNHVLPAERVV